MSDYIKLAWRNLWRNKRRTLITAASIFFGVMLSAFMTSMQEGSYAQYIKTVVFSYSGYIQIHKRGYWDDKNINNTLDIANLKEAISTTKGITVAAPRLENFALASAEEITKGVLVMGVSPTLEDGITSLSKKVIAGSYLTNGDKAVLVGSGLARYLKLSVNDTLVLLGQGFRGVSAAGKYVVRGLVKLPSPQLDKTVVYMDITQAQEFFTAPDRATAMVVMVPDNSKVKPVHKTLLSKLDGKWEVMDWEEINKNLIKQIESDRQSAYFTKGTLYMIIMFGILGTIMMMTVERRKEFGVLMAIGMQKFKLIIILWLETLFLTMIGVLAGIVASIPLCWYFTLNPIPFTGQAAETMMQMGFEPYMSFSMTPSVFYDQALIIFFMSIAIGIYPVINILRLDIQKALHN